MFFVTQSGDGRVLALALGRSHQAINSDWLGASCFSRPLLTLSRLSNGEIILGSLQENLGLRLHARYEVVVVAHLSLEFGRAIKRWANLVNTTWSSLNTVAIARRS